MQRCDHGILGYAEGFMTVEISDEVYGMLKDKVDRGEYPSVGSALDQSIRQYVRQTSDEWDEEDRAYLDARIEAGLADISAGRTIPAEQVLSGMYARLAKCE